MTFFSWNLDSPHAHTLLLTWFRSNTMADEKLVPAPLNSAPLESFLNVSRQNASGITGLCGLRNAGLLIPC